MATIEKESTRGASPTGVVPVLAIDAGNRAIKSLCPYTQKVSIMPSVVMELPSYQDIDPSALGADSVHIEIEKDGQRFSYLIGQAAKDMGGEWLFGDKDRKANCFWLIVAAMLDANGTSGLVGADEVRLLCPNSQNPSYKDAAEYVKSLQWLGDSRRYVRNGKTLTVSTIRNVKLFDEGIPAWRYANTHKLWARPEKVNVVIDCGGGDTVARRILPGGIIDRETQVITEGTSALAQMIGAALQSRFAMEPPISDIMDAIASGTYALDVSSTGRSGTLDFRAEFDRALPVWAERIKSAIRAKWKPGSQLWSSISEGLIVGASAPLLQSIEQGTQGRFKIARHEAVVNLAEIINVLGMGA